MKVLSRLIAPVAVVLVAENLGHVKAIGAMTGRSLEEDRLLAFDGHLLEARLDRSAGHSLRRKEICGTH